MAAQWNKRPEMFTGYSLEFRDRTIGHGDRKVAFDGQCAGKEFTPDT